MDEKTVMNIRDELDSDLELDMLNMWRTVKIYDVRRSVTANATEFRSMDGPPFVSSKTLHYGHFLVSYAKRTFNFYMTMKGYNALNKVGFDTHGLPIEMVINEDLGIDNIDQVMELGLDKYIDHGKKRVDEMSDSWKPIYERMSRWVDYDNKYMTKDTDFMESVMWAFSELNKKGLAYYGYNVVPFSVAGNTPLSNFEAKQNYKIRADVSLYLEFPVFGQDNTFFVAWTTTPWTLPSNLALAVHPKQKYMKIQMKDGKNYYVAEGNVANICKNKKEYTVISTHEGQELEGIEYVPPFAYFEHLRESGAFRVYADNFVKTTNEDDDDDDDSGKKAKNKPIGTGIVHCAPAFGADDFKVCTKRFISIKQIGEVCPVDHNGRFTDVVKEYAGLKVFDMRPVKEDEKNEDANEVFANDLIIDALKKRGIVLKKESYHHKYPHCWRTDTPLIYMAVKSYFVEVSKIKDRMIELNGKMTWEPEYVGTRRFEEWLKDAKDWGISRNRIFGTPIPVWISDDGEEIVVIGSIDELVARAGLTERPTDLHRDVLDSITIPSAEGRGTLKRIPDVFDCWFESGCVPFAQHHYPFEKPDMFDDQEFLSDFICEGLDQTRGWFYTLLVIATGIFDKPPFKTCICTGLILAADGKKMSKRLKNYPDPNIILDKWGSDALGLYLTNSPAICAEPFKFQEDGVKKTKLPLNQWFNALKFLNAHVSAYVATHGNINLESYRSSTNTMDKWIMSELGSLVSYIDIEMTKFKLRTILPKFVRFIDNLTNWYLKFNRERLKGVEGGREEWEMSLSTLFHVMFLFSQVAAPFTPYTAEYMYQTLRVMLQDTPASVMLCTYPDPKDFEIDSDVERRMDFLQQVSTKVRGMRNRYEQNPGDLIRFTSVRTPISKLTIYTHDSQEQDVELMRDYFTAELNCINIECADISAYSTTVIMANHRKIGQEFRKDADVVKKFIETFGQEQLDELAQGPLQVPGTKFFVDTSHVAVTTEPSERVKSDFNNEWLMKDYDPSLLLVADFSFNSNVVDEFNFRNFNACIQELRKDVGLQQVDKVTVYYSTDSEYVQKLLQSRSSEFENKVRSAVVFSDKIGQIGSTEVKALFKDSEDSHTVRFSLERC